MRGYPFFEKPFIRLSFGIKFQNPQIQPVRAQEFADQVKKRQELIFPTPELSEDISSDFKSIRILIPIQERGNSSSQLRMVHRQWYKKIQRSLDEENKIKTVKAQG